MKFIRACISVVVMPMALFAAFVFFLVAVQIAIHETLWKD